MYKLTLKIILLIVLLSLSINGQSAEKEPLILEHSDQFEIIQKDGRYVTFVIGKVHFKSGSGDIYCDSARWIKGENVTLNGNVVVRDTAYYMSSDSVLYDMTKDEFTAFGDDVILWTYKDSVYASGTKAFYNDENGYFIMDNNPEMYIKYPDTSSMIKILAQQIEHFPELEIAEAKGDVKISSQEFSAEANRAVMKTKDDLLELYDKPTARKEDSHISGESIFINFKDDKINLIDVIDSAKGEFSQIVDSVNGYTDKSKLSGQRILMEFENGEMYHIICYNQAYSWFYPSPRGSNKSEENSVSGDTIHLYIDQNQLTKVDVAGGVIGRYTVSDKSMLDTVLVQKVDTIDYNSTEIEYDILDSLITLKKSAFVKSGVVSLEAHQIEFDTDRKTIEAYSADVDADTIVDPYLLSSKIQPNIIPVRLKDKKEEILGDYLLYSIDTEKGRIVQSKANYDQGYYYGTKLIRESKEIYYVDDGRYTTCDADEPHFHFRAGSMKLMENDKLIAKPIVFYIEKVPVLALPFYVFPIKKGRHSGFLPFSFGQFERGERYIKNVGYYWAASDYWDWQGAFDYYENRRTLNFYSRINFAKRYVLNGYVAGNYTKETKYNSSVAEEFDDTRWSFQGNYSHIFSPSFNLNAYGSFGSDPVYTQDFTQNLEERKERSLKSQVSFNKKFGKSVSLTGNISHTDNLDRESRIDVLPSLNLSLPTLYPFGSGSKSTSGALTQKWYQKFSLRYNPSLNNYSSRNTLKSFDTLSVDTIVIVDTVTMLPDTSIIVNGDTVSFRTRKQYMVISHNPVIYLPQIKLGQLLNVVPSFSYNEVWLKVRRTDQSDSAGIDPSKLYRTNSMRLSIDANTSLYGAIYPNMLGIVGLRHVITPRVRYSYSPDINKHPEVRAYTGAGTGSSKSRTLFFSLNQLFQAKVKDYEKEKTIQLLSVTSSFSYDYEKEEKPLSNLSTSIRSSALPLIDNLSASMTHTFYNPETGEENFWSPYLLSFSLQASLRLNGKNFFFDDVNQIPQGKDSISQLNDFKNISKQPSGWSFSASYGYNQSGRGASLRKSSFINFNLNFNLTKNTSISYNQNYLIDKKIIASSSVNIIRRLHCWVGSIYWVPIGTNRGVGFRLFVSGIPDIKFDNNYSGFTESIWR
jgi:lipopolysaccharide assembly outer membrane protein LptD (OstA)